MHFAGLRPWAALPSTPNSTGNVQFCGEATEAQGKEGGKGGHTAFGVRVFTGRVFRALRPRRALQECERLDRVSRKQRTQAEEHPAAIHTTCAAIINYIEKN